jgi:hypothetical protein
VKRFPRNLPSPLLAKKFPDPVVQSIEERSLKDEAGHDVFAGEGQGTV